MPFVTFDQAIEKTVREGVLSEGRADTILREVVERAGASDRWDIFLSHASRDARVVYGVYLALRESGYSVYVDWLHDKHLDREQVTVQTAAILRVRMRQSKSLVFLATESAPKSKWMPWELGYFDGFKQHHVAILPVSRDSHHFVGQEYLLLYPWLTLGQVGSMKSWAIGDPNAIYGTKSFRDFVVG